MNFKLSRQIVATAEWQGSSNTAEVLRIVLQSLIESYLSVSVGVGLSAAEGAVALFCTAI